MFAVGALVGGRFRILRNCAPAANSIAIAEDLPSGALRWLVCFESSASDEQVREVLGRQERFAIGVPGLARSIAAGADGGLAFLAFVGSTLGSAAESREPWPLARVAALSERLAVALGPLHDQGIAHGLIVPELIAEAASHDVLAGFGAAALATLLAAPGEASQLVPPELRAPELRSALRPPTPASDVFALGALFARLLRGAESSDELPEGPVRALLERAQASEPSARLHDVHELAATLARFARPVPAPPVALLELEAPSPVAPTALPAEVAPSPLPAFGPAPLALPPRSSRWPVVVLSLGALLMLVGWLGVFVYVTRKSAKPVAVSAPSASAPRAPSRPAAPSPPSPLTPTPPAPELEAVPEISEPPAGRARRHAALVAPGVGPSSFPSEAHVALPISDEQPIWGTRSAPLSWVVFGDLECPHTRSLWRSLEIVKVRYGDDLRIVFRHRPLREHPHAQRAAQVLAGLQQRRGDDAFFKVLHRIAQGEADIDDAGLQRLLTLEGYAALNPAELAALGERTVADDLRLAGQFGRSSTPASFLNGQTVDGERSAVELEKLLSDEQRTATWLAASGLPATELYATRTSSNLLGVGDAGETRQCAPVGTSPSRGPKDALVTLVEFSDFECQYCKRVEPTLKALLARNPRTLRLVWKNYPLAQHPNARLLANFAFEAGRLGASGGFWAVHDGLFAAEDALDEGALLDLGRKLGFDGAVALGAARSGAHDKRVTADTALADKLGIGGTPTFFVNGRRVQGALPLGQFEALIQSELEIAQRIVARGVLARDLYGLVCD